MVAVSNTIANLVLPPALRTQLTAWAVDGYPQEVCGVLLGARADGATHVTKLTRARNLNTERARDRYLLDPQDQLAAENIARAEGLDVVGVWHTHPDHDSVPSETDREAAWEDWSYVIVATHGDGRADIRSWRLDGTGCFREEALAP